MISQDRCLALNVAAGNLAKVALELMAIDAVEQCKTLTAEEATHFCRTVWLKVFETAERETRDYRTEPLKEWAKPMRPVDAAAFGLTCIDFGKYTGRYIRDIAVIDLQYLEWIADGHDEFRKKLRGWLSWRDKQ